MAKKKNKPPESWEWIGRNGKFTRLYHELLESKAFIDLSLTEKVLFLHMKMQYKGNAAKNNPNGKPEQFYFNLALAKKYNICGKTTLYKAIDNLIEHGLIDCIENNKNLRKKNVYAFSDRWKNYG